METWIVLVSLHQSYLHYLHIFFDLTLNLKHLMNEFLSSWMILLVSQTSLYLHHDFEYLKRQQQYCHFLKYDDGAKIR